MEKARPNRLIREKSPYLLQHAHNPVDWYPWGDEAFEEAAAKDRPIFLSIGYSTCHWCHVMERESFEDHEVAHLLNEAFVCIKVDREERPDLDHIYMTVCQMFTGAGGWPLTIVMTPDKHPFFAATYLPKQSRYGRAGLMELIPRIQTVWKDRRGEVLNSAARILEALAQSEQAESGEVDPGLELLDQAYAELARRFDDTYGGFNQAPKFPTPHNLFFLLRYWKRTQKAHALSMVEKTLEAMARGGIFDHAGYGFHRYATDREWLVPHFEKMLYDQALLSLAYVEAFQATGREEYREVVKKILTYVQRDLTSPEGGFFSAEDADSEGVEGKFYVWTEEEIRQHLDTETADLFVKIFGVRPEGNFLEESTREKTGTNILHLPVPLDQMAAQAGLPEVHVREKMQDALNMLFKIREGRIHPFKDDKILTDWNGLMIAAFARASQVLAEPAYGLAAKKAADFVLKTLRDERGRLLHRYREGDPGIPGLVDDYAFLVWGLIELYQATFDAAFLKEALALTQDMLTWFWDQDRGGLFFAPSDGDALIVRKKELYDGAVPSGNSLALCNLLRLARLTGDSGLEDRAIQLGRAFAKTVAAMPSAYTHFLTGVDFALGPTWEVVIAGRPGGADTMQMIEALRSRFLPNMVALLRPVDVSSSDLERLAPFTVPYRDQGGVAAAYVCTGNACRSPTVDPNQMLKMLEE